ncbi:MAG TPA: T9SS type A sorting domain-containing protein [Candidatus Acidoferrales bacterium]|nr:T9SS type A sorting domain-containing protein [Candidatus Acidoferrales bacterium]
MKKSVLFIAMLLFLASSVRAQVLASFADSTLDGFVQNTGGSDSIYIAADPAAVHKHVVGWHMTLIGSNNAQMQTDNISVNGAQVLTVWIYIPSSANMPDTTEIGIWAMDHTHWSWKEVDTKASAIPKDTWFPLSSPLTELALQNPVGSAGPFDPVNNQIRLGMQIWGSVWTGVFYIANISIVGAKPTVLGDFSSDLSGPNSTKFSNQWHNGWVDSTYWSDTTLAGKTGVMVCQLKNGSASTGATSFGNQPDPGFAAQGQNFLVQWVYVDTTFPDTFNIQTWAQSDPSWNWPPNGPVTYNGINIPKKVWYPLYFDLAQASILDTGSGSFFNTYSKSTDNLRKYGIQIGGPNGVTWNGNVYVSNVSVINQVVAGPPKVWNAADFESAGSNGKEGFYVPKYASGTIKRYADLTTSDQSYVLQGTLNISKNAPKFAVARDTVSMMDADDSVANAISFGLYLPAKFPNKALVEFYVSSGKNDSVFVIDTVGSQVTHAQWNTLSITKLDSLAGAGKFDPTKPSQVGVVIWYPAPYDTTSWSGNIEFDNLVVSGISFPHELVDGVRGANSNLPKEYQLYANYPNPFNPSTTIKYDLPNDSKVVLQVYDVLGREVTTLVNEKQAAGSYNVKFDGTRYASGIYFVRLTADSFVRTQKMMLIK